MDKYEKIGLINQERGRESFFNRVNSGNMFTINSINNIPLDAKEKVSVKCNNCGEVIVISRKHAIEHTCPLCGKFESSNEHLIAKILDDSNVKYAREYRVEYTNAPIEYQLIDFYLPDFNLAIEHQGNQHYNPKNGHYNKDVVKRDNIKKEQLPKLGITIRYTYENKGLIYNQLQDILSDYGIKINKVIGSKYPPAQAVLDFIGKNQDKPYNWFLNELGYGSKTFDRYLKMTGLVGYEDALIYFRWKDIPDEAFLDYLGHNGIANTAKHFNKTVKTTTTHMHDLGYKSCKELQIERKLILDAFSDDEILTLVKEYSIAKAAEKLGFKKYHLEHYLPKIGYKNKAEVMEKYNPSK